MRWECLEMVGKYCCGILQGDSGGPLFANLGTESAERYTILGVVSYGDGCGEVLKPGVYASVQFYLHWIQDAIDFLQKI